MKEYTGFAAVYDMFMDNVPYDKWAKYLQKLLKENGAKDGIVCELGCGTGKMTRRLRDMGYDMIGVDISQDMLRIAMEHEAALAKSDILYLNQDMREFELFGTVKAVVSVCDSMNYITEKEDLLKTFKLAKNYLDPGGVFIFDMNTPYYYTRTKQTGHYCNKSHFDSIKSPRSNRFRKIVTHKKPNLKQQKTRCRKG